MEIQLRGLRFNYISIEKLIFRRIKMKKIVFIALIIALVTGISNVNAHASENDGEFGDVVMIAVPNENGGLKYYTGNEAKSLYMQIMNPSSTNISRDVQELMELPIENDLELRGPFTYRYRFVKESSGTKYGRSKRISNYLENRSSQTQNLQTSVSCSTSWYINTSLSGQFKKVFEASVGASWSRTSSFSQTITMNVGANKKMWLEFKPLLRYVSGKSQKYFIPRGPVKMKPIIVESKDVYSTSPKSISMTLGNKTFTGTDGAYVWKETKLR